MRLSCLLAFVVFNCAGPVAAASALHIEGGDISRQENRVDDAKVARGTLFFHVDGREVSITPWPDALPQHLGTQYVSIDLLADPAGPVLTVTFRSPNDTSPWLTLVANSPFGRQLVPNFRLLQTPDGEVSVNGRDLRIVSAVGVPVAFHDSTGRCWHFVLLGTSVQRSREGIADEKEPRADWYLRGDRPC
jgi:hypothetical protein